MNSSKPPVADTGPLQLRTIQLMLNGSYWISRQLAGRLCYRVLAKPPRKELEDAEAEFLSNAERATFQVGPMHIRSYHWPGKGPKVLLAHGWNSHSGRWYELGELLRKTGCDVCAIDAPAHGETTGGSFALVYYAEAMAALAENYRPDVIIGHSAGGMAAVYYMSHHLQVPKPSQLVLLATPAELEHFMDSFKQVIGIKTEVMTALEQEFLRRFGKPFAYYSTAEFAQVLDIPGLIIHDLKDDIAPPVGAHQLAKNWTESELIMTDGFGHSLQDQMIWQRIMDWLSV